MTEGSQAQAEAEAEAQTDPHQPSPRQTLAAWWWQGLRSAALRQPDWRALQTTPGIVACLVLAPWLAGLLIERLHIDGAATFHWPALLAGWLGAAATLWVCWLLIPKAATRGADEPAGAVALFSMLAAQALPVTVVCGLLFVPLARNPAFASTSWGQWVSWTAWGGAIGWFAVAQLALVWRSGTAPLRARSIATVLLLGTVALNQWFEPTRHWYPAEPQGAEADAPEPLKLTQELMERQPQLLQARLQAIGAGRPGTVDLYAITFAPYASESVFQRESQLVATLMQERFGAAERTVQLVNHSRTANEWPWATPLNLQRAIQRVAQVMNRDEDVVFIHLTSHGARDGQLAAEFWPLEIDAVTPQMLKGWLDDAGIRFRVISVSACYSGSWTAPLAGPGTLVMTAADAAHTSYGCGRGSPLTYFGRAMFDEQLRHTRSFEKAHAQARTVIDEREREAGKSDGYSNPQIEVGEQIRELLARFEAQWSPDAP